MENPTRDFGGTALEVDPAGAFRQTSNGGNKSRKYRASWQAPPGASESQGDEGHRNRVHPANEVDNVQRIEDWSSIRAFIQ